MVLGQYFHGISSGVFCVIFGIYEKLVNSVLNFFNDYKKNLKFLLPIVIGVFVGIIVFGNILKTLFNNFYIPTCFCIIGFIVGGIPNLIKQNTKKLDLNSMIFLLSTFFLSLYLVVIENGNHSSLSINTSFGNLILAGLFMSAGIVIPGVSSTVILMLFGIYETYLSAISSINIAILFPIAIGVIIGSFIFLKTIQFLLKHFSQYTYYAITGFTLGSIFVLFPGFAYGFQGIVSITLFIISMKLSYKMSFIKK